MNRKELIEQIFAKKSFLCVGLDTDINKLPKCITESEDIQGAEAEMIFRFNQAIIDATAPYCVAYKPNLAFYESRGIDGMIAFENTMISLLRTWNGRKPGKRTTTRLKMILGAVLNKNKKKMR